VVDDPSIAHFVAVCHPVGHDVKRYTQITQPVLLIFDIDDAGHPVSVGRLMRKYLPHPHYFEFAASSQPNWLGDNMGSEFVKMLSCYPTPDNVTGAHHRLPNLTRLAGGFRAWADAHGDEYEDYVVVDELEWEEEGVQGGGNSSSSEWEGVLDPDSNRVMYLNKLTGQKLSVRPSGVCVEFEDKSVIVEDESEATAGPLFEEPESEETRAARLLQEMEEMEARKQAEFDQEVCEQCNNLLFKPVRLVCRHALCGVCVEHYILHHRKCPLCGSLSPKPCVAKQLEIRLKEKLDCGVIDETLFLEQQQRYASALSDRQSSLRIVLEFGNTSRPDGNKHKMCSFVRVAGNGVLLGERYKGKRKKVAISQVIKRVGFNINPAYPKAAIQVSSPDRRLGFSLTRSMTRSFPCFMTIHFHPSLALPPLELVYFTQCLLPSFSRRVVVQILPDFPVRSNMKDVVRFEAWCGGWVKLGGGEVVTEVCCCLDDAPSDEAY